MKINPINTANIINVLRPIKSKRATNFIGQKNDLSSFSCENVKACFLPSFKAYQPVKEVFVYDRETNLPKNAVIWRDDIGDYTSLALYIDGEQGCAGYLHFKNEENHCSIRHLRTLDAGEKYSGIGTALVGGAIDESFLCQKHGCLWVISHKGYAKELSDYQKDTNPLPFYLKRGFVSLENSFQNELLSMVEQGKTEEYPDRVLLVLTPAEAVKFREKFDKDSVYLED